jgi:hypothetical protein
MIPIIMAMAPITLMVTMDLIIAGVILIIITLPVLPPKGKETPDRLTQKGDPEVKSRIHKIIGKDTLMVISGIMPLKMINQKAGKYMKKAPQLVIKPDKKIRIGAQMLT